MKKQLLTSLFAFLLVFSLCMGCSKAETGDKTTASDSFEVSSQKTSPVKITLNEVAHSVFYAPLYVAIEKGYFKDENIDLTLVTGFGADKTMTAVISGEAILDLWDLKLPFICTAKELPTMSLILHSSHSEPETFSLHGKTTSIFSGQISKEKLFWAVEKAAYIY